MERTGNKAGLQTSFKDLREVQFPKVKQLTGVDVLTYCGLDKRWDKKKFGVVKHLKDSDGWSQYVGETA